MNLRYHIQKFLIEFTARNKKNCPIWRLAKELVRANLFDMKNAQKKIKCASACTLCT